MILANDTSKIDEFSCHIISECPLTRFAGLPSKTAFSRNGETRVLTNFLAAFSTNVVYLSTRGTGDGFAKTTKSGKELTNLVGLNCATRFAFIKRL